MDDRQRNIKRAIIIAIYLAMFSVVAVGLYFMFRTKETCSDGIRNQDEEKIDCGGVSCAPCQEEVKAADLLIEKSFAIQSDNSGKAEVLALVTNPNDNFGSDSFQYRFELLDASGNAVSSREGRSFILPGETKYVVENDLPFEGDFKKVRFSLLEVSWVRSNDFYESPQLRIINRRYTEVNSGTIFSEAVGVIKNESPFDFNLISVKVILFDDSGMIVATNVTEMRTVKSEEEREFKVFWPNKFPGSESVARMEVQTEVNVLDSQAFYERYFETQRFQQTF